MSFLIVDILGTELTDEETVIIKHEDVAGVILFARNFTSLAQLKKLINALNEARPDLLIAIDHEGGVVQRIQREGIRNLPAARVYGEMYDKTGPEAACKMAFYYGKKGAADLLAQGIHLSLSPVLDLHCKGNPVIAGLDRAFHSDPKVVAKLGQAYILGMKACGMPAVGKHFPGHGSTTADSHTAKAVCTRSIEELEALDLYPFRQLMEKGLLDAVMPAHVTYPAVDPDNPAGYSKKWLQQLDDNITVISDCLGMSGADIGDLTTRAQAALNAGCNLLIVANQTRAALNELLDKEFGIAPSQREKTQQFIKKCVTNPYLPKESVQPVEDSVDSSNSGGYNNTLKI